MRSQTPREPVPSIGDIQASTGRAGKRDGGSPPAEGLGAADGTPA